MLDFYIKRQHEKQEALPAAEIDSLLEQQEADLLQAAAPHFLHAEPEPVTIDIGSETLPPPSATPAPIWSRVAGAQSATTTLKALPRKRGPKADIESHEKVVAVIRAYGELWTTDENLMEICDELDRQKIPAPKTWATRNDGHAHTWSRGLHHYLPGAHQLVRSTRAISARTWTKELEMLRHFFRFGLDNGWIVRNWGSVFRCRRI